MRSRCSAERLLEGEDVFEEPVERSSGSRFHDRSHGDDLYFTYPEQDFAPAEQRLPCADKLREYFAANGIELIQ